MDFHFPVLALQQSSNPLPVLAREGVKKFAEGTELYMPEVVEEIFGGDIKVQGWFTGGTCAQISWNGNDHLLKRLSSFAKINVNEEKLKEERFLNNGDNFQIGKNTFTYVVRE